MASNRSNQATLAVIAKHKNRVTNFGQKVTGSVELQHNQPTRRVTEIVNFGDGFLTAVAPLAEVNTRAQPIKLVGQSLCVYFRGLRGPVCGDS
jgi:hypothetical protein